MELYDCYSARGFYGHGYILLLIFFQRDACSECDSGEELLTAYEMSLDTN